MPVLSRSERQAYLDDDIAVGGHHPAAGDALLQRVNEYAEQPAAVEAYLRALESRLALRRGRRDGAGLVAALRGARAATALASSARERLVGHVSGDVPRPGSGP